MLRGLDMLKSRCCVLFGDLKVLLLRTPTPVSIPTTGHIPDSHVVPSEVSVPDNNTLTAHEGQRDVWTAPPPGAANGPERDRLSGWVDAAATEPSEVLHCSGSSDSWAKDKLEQRFSLCSYSESGSIRTPVCRICFQGPETVILNRPFINATLALFCCYDLSPQVASPKGARVRVAVRIVSWSCD